MRKSMLAPVALTLGLAFVVAGCGWVNQIKAKKNLKDAHLLYRQQEYKRAAVEYEEAIKFDPTLTVAYFYLGNSYDNLYKPGRQEPENDAYLEKAIQNYRLAAERGDDPKMRKLALEYLVAAYAPDKKNEPEQAEAVIKQIIELDPNEPTTYFMLAQVYEDSGRYEEAEAALLKAKEIRPQDSEVYTRLAGFYNRQGEFDKTIAAFRERASREPTNPEAFQVLAAYFWEKAYRDFRLPDKQKAAYVEEGIKAADKALELKNDYLDAVAFKNLLLREKAKYVKDRKQYDALIAEANRLQQRAIELQKKKTAGVGE